MNAIGMQLRDPINPGLTRWRMAVLNEPMNAAAELEGDPVKVSTSFSVSMEMCRLTRDGTAEPVLRDQTLRRERGQGIIHLICLAATTCRIGNLTGLFLVCFLPIYSGYQVRWTYQPGSHRRKVTQDFSSIFLLRCVP